MTAGNCKIALVNPRVESYSSTLPPLGLLYIAAVLRDAGFNVRVFDIYPYDDRDLDGLTRFDPDVVGMTILTDYLSRALHVAGHITHTLSQSTFIIGGVHVTALPEESLRDFKADIAVVGEGEETMLELCRHLCTGTDWRVVDGIAYLNEKRDVKMTASRNYVDDLDVIPFPARELLSFEDYLVPPGIIRGVWSERSTTVMTSRGCPFTCVWCGSMCTFGRKVRYRSVDNVIEELRYLVEEYRIDTVWFVDDTFTLDKKRVLEFCEKLQRSQLNIKWGCQAHVKTADEEMFKTMQEAGLVQLDFGVESGSDKVLETLEKKSSAAAVKSAFFLTKKLGIRTTATFIFGSPGETEGDVALTFRLAKEINPNFVSSFFLTPYPGTKLMELAEENKWISKESRDGHGLKKRPFLKIHFSEEELLEIRRKFQRQFALRNFSGIFFNPSYLLKAALLVMSYPLGVFRGLRVFFKSRVFDDFIFEFLIYYTSKKQDKKKFLG